MHKSRIGSDKQPLLIHGDVIRAKLLDKTTISGHFDAIDEKGIWVIVSGTSSSTCFDLHAFSAFAASRNPSANCCGVEPTEVVSLQSDSSRNGDPFLQPGENGLKTNWDGMDSLETSELAKGNQDAKGDVNDHHDAKEEATEHQDAKGEATDQKAIGEATKHHEEKREASECHEAVGEATEQVALGEVTEKKEHVNDDTRAQPDYQYPNDPRSFVSTASQTARKRSSTASSLYSSTSVFFSLC